MVRKIPFAAAIVISSVSIAQASELSEDQMRAVFDAEIAPALLSPEVVSAVAAQNARHAGLTQDEITERDLEWRGQVGMSDAALVASVVENAVADRLREVVDSSGGRITEIFIMDAEGLNVAASAATTDYWQGDEAKFTETFGAGRDAVHVGDVTYDESTGRDQRQLSVTLLDPETGEPIGAVTAGIVDQD
ncbi:hypothetical protein RM543_11790 [Roseicyclus sp. F158]|uniref:Uncharacterized protein n=1 Tax=Tropicimonas omnivorans TaxID=3075590 RepID=A0ABU3DI46_9RHOB|nr:hypothetical protein [Roseicyclus sp. F158]MDT0683370.1 hypothetical protein [Roseicyclus sp. F158]